MFALAAAAAEAPPATPGVAARGVDLTILRRGDSESLSHVTVGVPFPDRTLASAKDLVLLDSEGRPTPLQSEVTATWAKDGPVKWVLLDFQVRLPAEQNRFRLEFNGQAPTPVNGPAARAVQTPEGFRVTTGPLQFDIRREGFDLIHAAWLDADADGAFSPAEQIVQPAKDQGPYLVDAAGKVYRTANDRKSTLEMEVSGPLRVCLKAQAWYVADDGERLCQAVTRIHAFRGKSYLRVIHTFIFTADSNKVQLADVGLTCPMAVRSAAAGSDAPVEVATSALRLVQYEHDRHEITTDGKTLARGGPASGWIRARGDRGTLTVALRDFWQTFPKELETGPAGVIVHLWPAHNVAVPPPVYTEENVGNLWFVHHGRLLDFRVPKEVSQFPAKRAHNYLQVSAHTNAMGVARTHELLYWFQPPAAAPVDGNAVQALIQQPPHAVADPKWVAATDAFGPLHYCDPDRFPETERALSLMFDFERSVERHNLDYGLFAFGNGHTYWSYADKTYNQVDRPWRNMHHGGCRAPWLLYARSGDPKYFDYARRNTLFNLDVGICHYATPEFEDHPFDTSRKIKGALTDYKGIVPWSSGRRLADYNAMTDFMLYDFYLTGDRRGFDVAQEWGQAMKKRVKAPGDYGGRGWAGPCAALIALYQATWDPEYDSLARAYAARLIAAQQPDGGYTGWANYAPWLLNYYRLTRDPAAAAAAVRWSDCVRRLSERAPSSQYSFDGYGREDGFALYDVQAVAYAASGDRDILADALGKMLYISNSVMDKPGSFADGAPLFSGASTTSYFAQTVPYVMRPLAGLRGQIEPLFPRWPARFPLDALLWDQDDAEVTLEFGRSAAVRIEVVAPDGAKVIEKSFDGPPAQERFTLPPDGKRGLYRITLNSPDGKGDVQLPIASSRPVKMIYRMPPPSAQFSRGCALYFRTPPGTDTVEIEMAGRENTALTTALYAPMGERLAVCNWYSAETPGPARLRAPLPPERRGQTLCFLQGASKWLTLSFISPRLEYFADRPDRWFDPAAATH